MGGNASSNRNDASSNVENNTDNQDYYQMLEVEETATGEPFR